MNGIFTLLGLAQRAGKVVTGADGVKGAINSGKARLVILAEDLSVRIAKDYTNMCRYRKIPFIKYATKVELGLAIGKSPRGAAAVNDENFARAMLRVINEDNKEL